MKLLPTLAAVVALTGCGGVDYGERIDPIMKQSIDDVAEDGDCDALQAAFDLADHVDDPDRMGYIDQVMDEIGCY
ncbi:MAG TPA: hypothetical protein VFK52_08095 [Nocardioidaceae bacterium]|nr:hypothetical protein [Nocardioidaceae bacterium]